MLCAPYAASSAIIWRTDPAAWLYEDRAVMIGWLIIARKAQSEWEAAARRRAKWESAIYRSPACSEHPVSPPNRWQVPRPASRQRFADSWLRTCKDEAVNGIERPNVDIRDAAARLGIDPNADPKAICACVESAWRF